MASHSKLIELRPDRSFLDSDFDGYKLSLTQIETNTTELKAGVHRLVPDINQYSLLHAKLFALHNHLTGENDGTESVYFIDKDLYVQKYAIEAITNQFSCTSVWKVPLQAQPNSGDYNMSLKFASDKIAVISDGMGWLYVLDRGSKDIDDKWQLVFSGEVAGPAQKFIITDVAYESGRKAKLHLLLSSIRQNLNERHSTILHWITMQESDSWNQVALRELIVNGFVQYANFERTCDAVYVISDSGCKFTLDSDNEISKNPEESSEVEKVYKWTQGREDITIKFSLNENVIKNLLQVNTEDSRITVKYRDEILLQGGLFQRIDSNMTCWTTEDAVLEVVLQKGESGLWPKILEDDDDRGEFIADPSLVEEITERLAPLTSSEESAPSSGTTFNSQQVEECDFECDKLTIFERLGRNSHQLTHKVNLGSHQVLLSVRLDKDLPLALGIRSDVDTCIWQPENVSNEFSLTHKGTLLAMGYIQASKQQMKFFVCSPDLNYSVICESTKHVFIYCQNKSVSSSELRNRVTGRRVRVLAQQQVYSLPSSAEILGVYASNAHLYILGDTFITTLKL